MHSFQDANKDGCLKFEEKPMEVDIEPVQIMMVDITEHVNPRHDKTPIAKENMNKAFDEFENEVEGVFLRARDTLAQFLIQKKVCDRDIMLCPCGSAVFDRSVEGLLNHLRFEEICQPLKGLRFKTRETYPDVSEASLETSQSLLGKDYLFAKCSSTS